MSRRSCRRWPTPNARPSSAFDEGLSSITKFAAGFVTLAVAWKVVKAGFGMVSDFLAASVKAAAESSAIYSAEITKLDAAWKGLHVSVGQTITQNQTVVQALGGVTSVLQGVSQAFLNNQAAMDFVSDTVILLIRGFGFLMDVLGKLLVPVQWQIKQWQLLANIQLKFIGIMLSAAKAVAPYNAQMAQAATQMEATYAAGQRLNDNLQRAADMTQTAQTATAALATSAATLADRLEDDARADGPVHRGHRPGRRGHDDRRGRRRQALDRTSRGGDVHEDARRRPAGPDRDAARIGRRDRDDAPDRARLSGRVRGLDSRLRRAPGVDGGRRDADARLWRRHEPEPPGRRRLDPGDGGDGRRRRRRRAEDADVRGESERSGRARSPRSATCSATAPARSSSGRRAS